MGGETAAPLFILGDFAEAFVGERSPFEEVAMRKATLLGVHTAVSRRVLGGFSARSRQNLGKICQKAPKGSPKAPKESPKAAKGSQKGCTT